MQFSGTCLWCRRNEDFVYTSGTIVEETKITLSGRIAVKVEDESSVSPDQSITITYLSHHTFFSAAPTSSLNRSCLEQGNENISQVESKLFASLDS